MEYTIIRSARRTIALQIQPDGQVVVRCPYAMGKDAIDTFVAGKSKWLEKHLKNMQCQEPPLLPGQIQALVSRAKEVIPPKVDYYANMLGVDYGKITVRCQQTRWGSCTTKGNLSFNCLLMLAPPTVLDYVVVHELCHRKQMNHSHAFWEEVAKAIPHYTVPRKWLKDNARRLIGRVKTR